MLEGRFASVADQLFEVGAVKFGAFKLKLHETQPDAPLSPIYLNLRTPDNPKPGPLTPEVVDQIADLLHALLHQTDSLEFWYVAGIPNAGEPLAAALMSHLDPGSQARQIRLYKEETASARRIAGLIDGNWDLPGRVLLVDDLITQADSKLEGSRRWSRRASKSVI